jgi:hypothetical protein
MPTDIYGEHTISISRVKEYAKHATIKQHLLLTWLALRSRRCRLYTAWKTSVNFSHIHSITSLTENMSEQLSRSPLYGVG